MVLVAAAAATTQSTAMGRDFKKAPSDMAQMLVMGLATILLVGDILFLTVTWPAAYMVDAAFVWRWLHFVSGITWIGLLYFFNFVNVPFIGSADASFKQTYLPKLIGRALFWFRWSSMLTVLAGFGLIFWSYGVTTATPTGILLSTAAGRTITVGMLLGLVMVFNVWRIIWPNQNKVITATEKGEKPDPAWGKQAMIASRMNVVLSFPMLLMMAGGSHYPMNDVQILVALVVAGAASWGMIQLTMKS
ncbi:MAG: urate hydroxylase PuuD [Euryarchaeota archaeon]|nr:urate hydroxylase PuuD [Euryarchaeota archaeon]